MAKYIDAEALLDEVLRMRNCHLLSKSDGAKVEKMVRKFPAADVAPVVYAHWLPKQQIVRSPYAKNYACSNCEYEPLEATEYCPNCGAKMDGEK